MSRPRDPLQLTVYVTLMIAAGGLIVEMLTVDLLQTGFDVSAPFLLLAGGALLGEHARFNTGTRFEQPLSAAFLFAILLTEGVAAAVLTQVLASLVASALTGKRLDRACFDAARLTFSWVAAGVVIGALAGPPGGRDLSALELAYLLPGMVTFLVVSSTVVRVAEALTLGRRSTNLLRDLAGRWWPTAMMLGVGAPVAAAISSDVLLVPLMALPLVAAHHATRQAAQMEHLARHDSLTGLPSRLLFEDATAQAILAAKRSRSYVPVMLLDLDGFKAINDTLGHEHGDELLKRISQQLRDQVGDGMVARLGGDEFAIMLNRISTPAQAAGFAQRLLTDLREPLTVNSVTLDVRGSMGIACFPRDGEDVQTLLRHADGAMYSAKRTPRRYQFFVPARDDHSPGRLAMAGALKEALETGELEIHYQPKVDLVSGAVKSVEALARWERPGKGTIPPSEFIRVAEHTGLIEPLTMRVLVQALDDCVVWQEAGHDVGVTVNLSVRSILDRNLPARIARLLSQRSLAPSCLELEITESVLMADPGRAKAFLVELRDIGIGLSVDDFGTGYSSLAYLKDLPINCVKIDRSFVTYIDSRESDAMLVKSIIDLGHNLGLLVVAEGIESQPVLEALAAMGCDIGQGYHFARPLSFDDMGKWLRRPGSRVLAAA